MRYQLKQRFIGFGDDFYIYDESGEKRYFIDGYAFSFGQKFAFKDVNGRKIGMIKKRLFTFFPSYNVTMESGQSAIVKKSPFAFRDKFIIDVPGPDDYTVVGRLIEHEYNFYRNKQVEATVSRKFFRATDTYSVDIPGAHNHELLLACAVAIDMVCHNKKSKYDR